MFAELLQPDFLLPEELDLYLADGWFRMGQSIFTTNFLRFHDHFYSAIWLRIDLFSFEITNTQKKLLKQNARFRVEIQPAVLKTEQEELFSRYRENITFETSPSLSHLLFDNGRGNIYNTYEINIYDQSRLIAGGFFDLGATSAAGINCYYDPEYKKYSLGKFLMFLKMDFCRERGFEFFYPGYFAPGYSMFDYKLDLAKSALQYLDLTTQFWNPVSEIASYSIPVEVMTEKLQKLSLILKENDFEHSFLYYDFFDAGLVSYLSGMGLMEFPVFIYCLKTDANIYNPIVVYDVRDNLYHLVLSSCMYETEKRKTLINHYSSHLLKVEKDLFANESAEIMAAVILQSIRKQQTV